MELYSSGPVFFTSAKEGMNTQKAIVRLIYRQTPVVKED